MPGRFGLLAAAVCVAYLNAFTTAFQFDDYNVIVDNAQVHSFSAWYSGLAHGIRPLLKFTYMLNWTSGTGVFGFHLFNLSIHVINAVLVYLLTRKFFDYRSSSGPDGEFIALATALLFALHPVQTEAVTYISGRSMSLMAFFYLGSMLAYVHGAEGRRKTLLYVVSPFLFVAAVAVKETAVTLPFALVLWEASSGKAGDWKASAKQQALHWGLLAFCALFFVLHPAYADLLAYGFGTRSVSDNLLSQINGVSYLLSRLIFISRLNIDPVLPVMSAWTPLLVGEALFLAALLLAGLVSFRRRPWLGFGLLWFLLHLLPTNSIIPRLDIANERHLYLAVWGLFLGLCGEIAALHRAGILRSRTIRTGAAVVLLLLCFFTVMRNRVYRSEVSLWEATVNTSPDNARAHNNLGYAYSHAGRGKEALAEYREALRLRPGYRRASENIAALTHTPAEVSSTPSPP
jgi:protein O-mannosyl-transferase